MIKASFYQKINLKPPCALNLSWHPWKAGGSPFPTSCKFVSQCISHGRSWMARLGSSYKRMLGREELPQSLHTPRGAGA